MQVLRVGRFGRPGELVSARSRRRAGAIAVFATLAGAAACSSGAVPSTAGSPGVGGTLAVAMPAPPASLDPALGGISWAYDPLIVQAPNGTFQPGLALSWHYGPRNESFSMTLRPGVRFSDGTAFDAQALKTWFEYEFGVAGNSAQLYMGRPTKIAVTGPLSLTLYFSTPTPLLPWTLSQNPSAVMPASPKAVRAKSLATTTDGTGEYELDPAQTVAGDHYTYVPNPYYWNKKAVHWKTVVVKVMTNPSTILQAMETGQVQVAIGQPASSVPTANRSGLKALTPMALIVSLDLADRNGKLAKPLADVRVRQALNYAVDRTAMAKALGGGFGQPIDQMALIGDDSYDPSLTNAYSYDPAKAKQLLAAAGYPNGFSFTAIATPVVGLDTFGEALVGQLAKIGVTMHLDIKDLNSFSAAVSNQQYSAFTISWGRDPAMIQYENLWGPARTFGNPFGSANQEIASLYSQLIVAPAARDSAIAQQMQSVLVRQAWFLPVYSSPLAVIYSPTVTGIRLSNSVNQFYGPQVEPAG